MAKIPDWHDIGPVDYSGPSMITTHDANAMAAPGRATAQLGESIASAGKAIGGALASLEDENNKQEDLDAEMKFRNFQASQSDQYAAMERNMPEDGTGFRDNFSSQYFNGAKDFLANTPDRLKGQYDQKLRADHIEFEQRARSAEYRQQDIYQGQQVGGALDKIYGDIDNSDDQTSDYLNKSIRQGQGVIDASPLPPNRKLELKRQFSNQAETRYFAARSKAIDQMQAEEMAKPNPDMEAVENARDQLESEIKARGQNPLDQPGANGPGPTKINMNGQETISPFEVAKQYLGKTEGRDHDALAAFFKKSGGLNIDPSDTAWCAAFVNSALGASGQEGTGKLDARSFLNYGTATKDPSEGDIVVLWRDSPDSWKGHVGFYAGRDKDGNVLVLGGNQGRDGDVSMASFPENRVLGFRHPPKAGTQIDGITTGSVDTGASATPTVGPSKPLDGDIDGIVERAAKDQGIDPDMMRAFAHIESAGDPKASNGSYQGLFQLSPDEFRANGGRGNIYDAEANANAAAQKLKGEIADFSDRYGRDPTPGELYMIHQQGKGGAEAHWDNPDQLAWKSMASTAEGQKKGVGWAKNAIWGNLTAEAQQKFGSVDNITSKDFTDFWNGRVAEMGGGKIAPEQATKAPVADAEPTKVASLDPRSGLPEPATLTPGQQAVQAAGLPITVQDRKGATAATFTPGNNIATVLDGVPDNIPLSQVPADVRNQVYSMFPKEALAAKAMQDGTQKSALDVMTVGAVKEALASQLRPTQRVADANGGLYPQKPTFNYITENDRAKMLKQLTSDRKSAFDSWTNLEYNNIVKSGEDSRDSTGQTLIERVAKSLPPASVAKIKAKLDEAHGVFNYVKPMKEWDEDTIDQHLADLQPANGDTPAEAQRKAAILGKAEKEAKRVKDLRQKDIAAAADELPEVGAARTQSKALMQSLITGTDINGDPVFTDDKKAIGAAQTRAWEGVIQARKDAQDRIGIDTGSQRILTKAEARGLFNNVPWNRLTEEQQMQTLTRAANAADARYGKFARQAFNEAVQQVVAGEDSLELASKIGADLTQKMVRGEAITTNDVNRFQNARQLSPMETFVRGGQTPGANADFNAPGESMWQVSPSRAPFNPNTPAIGQRWSPPDTSATQQMPLLGSQNGLTVQASQKAIGWLLQDPLANSGAFDRMYGAGTAAQIIKLMGKLQSPQGAGAGQ